MQSPPTSVKQRFLSFEDYLSYDDGTENLYELFNGELIAVPPESGENVQIANRLFWYFALLLGTDRIRGHGLELEVSGEPRNRYPDLTIIQEEHIHQLKSRNTLRLEMAAPQLVVEIVSPGEVQRERDYIAKRYQYQQRGIPEYWIVDPMLDRVTVLWLVDALYTETIFEDGDTIRSLSFPQLAVGSSCAAADR
jgi:Uma2 family endonuclease